MKKLSLRASIFQKGEVLTRDQLKKVLGGDGSDGGSSGGPGVCNFHCCSDQHTNCTAYVSSTHSCNTSNDCNSTMASCNTGHLYWSCF